MSVTINVPKPIIRLNASTIEITIGVLSKDLSNAIIGTTPYTQIATINLTCPRYIITFLFCFNHINDK